MFKAALGLFALTANAFPYLVVPLPTKNSAGLGPYAILPPSAREMDLAGVFSNYLADHVALMRPPAKHNHFSNHPATNAALLPPPAEYKHSWNNRAREESLEAAVFAESSAELFGEPSGESPSDSSSESIENSNMARSDKDVQLSAEMSAEWS